MYRWIVLIHVLSALLFMAAHGVSIALCFRIRSMQTPEEVKPVLDLSRSSFGAMFSTFGLLALSGLAAAIWGEWWRMGWFWASVIVLVGVALFMSTTVAMSFQRIRRAAGLSYVNTKRQLQPPLPPDVPEMRAAIAASRPWLQIVVGFVGVAILTWLMMFKPF